MIRGLDDPGFLNKLYSGWLGKIIGVKTGMYVENWSSDSVIRGFGHVDGPITRYDKRFAADDDTNGPAFYPQALDLFPDGHNISPSRIADGLMNYCGDHHGFFWWGGDGSGCGYNLFKQGLRPPHTVSDKKGESLAGTIFTDGWGLLMPCSPERAADLARRQNATHMTGQAALAGGYLCACISLAYAQDDIEKVVEGALKYQPPGRFRDMVEGVLAFYRMNPSPCAWKDAHAWMMEQFVTSQADEPYNVHANTACILIALLYGRESFDMVMNIGTMCAWDCDCNLANAGAIMGVLVGARSIPSKWRDSINDFLCTSSTVGSMNAWDVPTLVKWFARTAYQLADEAIDDPVSKSWVYEDDRRYHFELPGSTHALMTEQSQSGRPEYALVTNTDEEAHTGTRSLKIVMPRATTGKPLRVYAITYPCLNDFDVFGYQPDFSPILYPGQRFSLYIKPRDDTREGIIAKAYVLTRDGSMIYGEPVELTRGMWRKVGMTVPSLADVTITRAGAELTPTFNPDAHNIMPRWAQVVAFYVDDFVIEGSADYEITFQKEVMEPQGWGPRHVPGQCSYTRGDWCLVESKLVATHIEDNAAECYTGDYLWRDLLFEADIEPLLGVSHGICARVRGGMKSVGLRLIQNDTLELYRNDCGYATLTSAVFPWLHGRVYRLALCVKGDTVQASVDGVKLLEAKIEDPALNHGCVGFVNGYRSLTRYHRYAVRPLENPSE